MFGALLLLLWLVSVVVVLAGLVLYIAINKAVD